MDILEGITLSIAVLGAVLGLLNTWRTLDRDRPKLRVTPSHAVPFGGYASNFPNVKFAIEVVNLSTFPLTISEVGFLHKGLATRGAVMRPITVDDVTTPRRLEPREAVSFYMERPPSQSGHPLTYAYARTACGRTFKGTSPALLELNY